MVISFHNQTNCENNRISSQQIWERKKVIMNIWIMQIQNIPRQIRTRAYLNILSVCMCAHSWADTFCLRVRVYAFAHTKRSIFNNNNRKRIILINIPNVHLVYWEYSTQNISYPWILKKPLLISKELRIIKNKVLVRTREFSCKCKSVIPAFRPPHSKKRKFNLGIRNPKVANIPNFQPRGHDLQSMLMWQPRRGNDPVWNTEILCLH